MSKVENEIPVMSKKDLALWLTEYDGENYPTPKKAGEVIEDVFNVVVNALAMGKEISISRFGAMKVISRPERKGRNPRTGETITLPSKRVVRFKPACALRKDIQSTKES